MPRRPPAIVVALAIIVAGSATLFGFQFAGEEHGHEEAASTAQAPEPEHAGAGHESEGDEHEDAGVGAAISAILIGIAGGALAPASALLARRRDEAADAAAWTEAVPARVGTVPATLAALSTGAAAIHFAVVAQHLDEWWLSGIFFIAVAAFQLVWALGVLYRPSPRLYLVGAVVTALVVITWVVSRTTGVPVGPEAGEPESVGLADLVATGFEAVIVAFVAARLARVHLRLPRVVAAGGSWLAGAIIASLTALVLAVLP